MYNPQNEACNATRTKRAKIKTKRETTTKRSVPSVRFFITAATPHFFQKNRIIGKTKSAILKNEKYIFLVFSDLFGRGCLTAVQSPLKRYLIG